MRTKDQILDRAAVLLFVAAKASGAPEAHVSALANDYRAAEHLSPDERAFHEARLPDDRTSARLAWRFEAARILLWALGLTELHAPGDRPVAPSALVALVRAQDIKPLRRRATLRGVEELEAFREEMYERHWELRDARLRKVAAPPGRGLDEVLEWDHAIRWILNDPGEAWDDVSLDT